MNELQAKNKLPFFYLVSSGALNANASGQVTLVLQTDSFFELVSLGASCTMDTTRSDGAALANPFSPNNFSVQITDLSTGRQLSNARIPQRVITPQRGFYFPQPILFTPSSNLLFDFLDVSGATNTISLVLQGYKVFNM